MGASYCYVLVESCEATGHVHVLDLDAEGTLSSRSGETLITLLKVSIILLNLIKDPINLILNQSLPLLPHHTIRQSTSSLRTSKTIIHALPACYAVFLHDQVGHNTEDLRFGHAVALCGGGSCCRVEVLRTFDVGVGPVRVDDDLGVFVVVVGAVAADVNFVLCFVRVVRLLESGEGIYVSWLTDSAPVGLSLQLEVVLDLVDY